MYFAAAHQPKYRTRYASDGGGLTPDPGVRWPGKWGETFKEFPPIQKPNTFTLDDALKSMEGAATGH